MSLCNPHTKTKDWISKNKEKSTTQHPFPSSNPNATCDDPFPYNSCLLSANITTTLQFSLFFFLWSDVLEWKEAAWISLVFALEVIDDISGGCWWYQFITSTIDLLSRFWWRNFVTITGTHLSLMLWRIWQVTAMKQNICLMSLWKMVWPRSGEFGICQVSCSRGYIWILEQPSRCPHPCLVARPLSVGPSCWSLSVVILIDSVQSWGLVAGWDGCCVIVFLLIIWG